MNFQLPPSTTPTPFGQDQQQPNFQSAYMQQRQQLTPDQQNAVNGNGMMPEQAAPQQYGQPNQVPNQASPNDSYLNHPKTPAPGANDMAQADNPGSGMAAMGGSFNGGMPQFNGSQSALADAMRTNPGAGYLQRGLGGAPAPSPQLQGVAQQVRPPPAMRAQPQPNRVAGYQAYRTR